MNITYSEDKPTTPGKYLYKGRKEVFMIEAFYPQRPAFSSLVNNKYLIKTKLVTKVNLDGGVSQEIPVDWLDGEFSKRIAE